MKQIKNLYKSIVNAGIMPELKNYEKRIILLINNFSLFTITAATTLLLPISIASTNVSIVPLITCICGIVFIVVSIDLNRRKYYVFAKSYFISMILFSALAIFLIRGRDSGSLFLFLPAATLSAIFFKNRSYSFLFYGIICLFFISCVSFSYKFPPIVKTSNDALRYMYHLYAFVGSILLFMIVYFFKTTTEFDEEVLMSKNNDITSSIMYAKSIQDATLAIDVNVKQKIVDYFVYYKPKDLVSGDFYNIKKIDNKIVFSIADCTGHGVSGALMSIIGVNNLKQTIVDGNLNEPNQMLISLNKSISNSLNQKSTLNNDSMDMGIIVLDILSKEIKYAGANLSMFICDDDGIQVLKGCKCSIGGYNNDLNFIEVNNASVKMGDMLYLSTDGYKDQFGGPNDKKLKTDNFKSLLSSINQMPLVNQQYMIKTHHELWKGSNEQTDDILVLGIRV